MEVEAERREFATRLGNALEMAETEVDVLDVLERTLHRSVPDLATELLLADNSHSHLERMLVASPDGVAPGLPGRGAAPVRRRTRLADHGVRRQ